MTDNMVSVDQAKSKVCPILTIASAPQVSQCVAKACMMWRRDGSYRVGDDDKNTEFGHCGLCQP